MGKENEKEKNKKEKKEGNRKILCLARTGTKFYFSTGHKD
jgi:hypothetical protein